MYLKAKSYKRVFRYDLINTLKFIQNNDLKVRGKIAENIERLAMAASANNSLRVMKYLITKMNLDVGFDEDHILKDALHYEYWDMAKLALSHGAKIQSCYSSMIDACIAGKYDTVKYMLDHGFMTSNESIVTVCENGHLRLLKLLSQYEIRVEKSIVDSLEQYSCPECYDYLLNNFARY